MTSANEQIINEPEIINEPLNEYFTKHEYLISIGEVKAHLTGSASFTRLSQKSQDDLVFLLEKTATEVASNLD